METFFGRLKNEMFYGFEKDYPSFQAFSKAIAEYIDFYNNSRIQSKTKWMPPPLSQVKKLAQRSNSIFAICNSTLLLLH